MKVRSKKVHKDGVDYIETWFHPDKTIPFIYLNTIGVKEGVSFEEAIKQYDLKSKEEET